MITNATRVAPLANSSEQNLNGSSERNVVFPPAPPLPSRGESVTPPPCACSPAAPQMRTSNGLSSRACAALGAFSGSTVGIIGGMLAGYGLYEAYVRGDVDHDDVANTLRIVATYMGFGGLGGGVLGGSFGALLGAATGCCQNPVYSAPNIV